MIGIIRMPMLRQKIVARIETEKKILSISSVTGLSSDEVMKKTKGAYLDVVLKVACMTGECMDYQQAHRLELVHAITSHETGREIKTIEAI